MGEREWTMAYNSERDNLIIPEYGRHVQNLVEEAKKVESPEERQVFVSKIVDLMMQIHPQSRNIEDYIDKLWKHVFRISNYELDGVMPPNGELPTAEDAAKRPEMISYPESEAKFRHYGHNVQYLIKKAIEMPEGPKRDGFVAVIASYMKLAYRTWNKEHFVSDEVVKSDLESLSGGKLVLKEELMQDTTTNNNRRRKRPSGSGGKRSRSSSRRRR
jgi:hypothetical protein